MIKDLIRKHEGLRLERYNDIMGYDTIGYGHLIRIDEQIGQRITQEQAEELFERDYARAVQIASNVVPSFYYLSEARQAVLIDMAFNMGYRLSYFKRFIECVGRQDWLSAIVEMCRSKWARQVPGRVIDLIPLMAKGEWV